MGLQETDKGGGAAPGAARCALPVEDWSGAPRIAARRPHHWPHAVDQVPPSVSAYRLEPPSRRPLRAPQPPGPHRVKGGPAIAGSSPQATRERP